MKAPVFFETAALVSQLLIGCALLIGLLRFRRLSRDQLILFSLVSVAILTELAGRILWTYHQNNVFLYHFYTVLEFLLLITLYTEHLKELLKLVYIRSIMALFVVFALINTLFFQSLKEFNSHVTFVESLLLILFSVLYFYKLLRDLQHRKLERVPMFWINMSVLTYFSGALILFHVANELIPLPMEEREVIWGTHALFNIVHYFLYGVALWVKPERT